MSQVITTQEAKGKAVFSEKAPEQQTSFDFPIGKMTILSSTHSFAVKLDMENDIDTYLQHRMSGFGPGIDCPPQGTAASIIDLAPGLQSPMRRQQAVGVFYLLEGCVILQLDGGEKRTLKAGVLRANVHSWKNVSRNDGSAKLLAFSQSIA